jgi:hypothetical protein
MAEEKTPQQKRIENRKAEWASSWEKAYDEFREESLKGKTCNAPGCPCGGKASATHYVKQKGKADLSKPAIGHSFGEVIAQIKAGKVGCDLAKKKTSNYKRVIDRQAEAISKETGISIDAARALLEGAKNK